MTAGAHELYRWMRFRGGRTRQVWWGQGKMAADLKISVATLKRRLSELYADGCLKRERRGPRSNMYLICGKPVQSELSFELSIGTHLFTESKTMKEEQPRRKPVQPETFQEPPIYIRSEHGYQHLNPAWQEWRDREIRISRARNPEAYRRAIRERVG